MANPETLASGIVDRLKTISGLTVYNGWPNQVNTPCVIVDLAGDEPEQTMGRGDLTRWDYDIELLYSLAGGEPNARSQLYPLLATSSTGGVYGAIHGDRTLGGIAYSTFVKYGSKPERRFTEEGIGILQATIRVEVWAS
jgi:hypothetical protein